jgi:hypothetical protein
MPRIFGILKPAGHRLGGGNFSWRVQPVSAHIFSHLADWPRPIDRLQGLLDALAVGGPSCALAFLDNFSMPGLFSRSFHEPHAFTIAALSFSDPVR